MPICKHYKSSFFYTILNNPMYMFMDTYSDLYIYRYSMSICTCSHVSICVHALSHWWRNVILGLHCDFLHGLARLTHCTALFVHVPLSVVKRALNESLPNRARHSSASLAMDIYMIPLLIGTKW